MNNVIKASPCKHDKFVFRDENGAPRCKECGVLLSWGEYEEVLSKMKNSISAPSYYMRGKIETWDFIVDKQLDFLEGNVVKYIVRWREKNGVEDLKKARVYLDKLIKEAEKHE